MVDESTIVYYTRAGHKYHTKRNCPHLRQATNPTKSEPAAKAPRRLDICLDCSDQRADKARRANWAIGECKHCGAALEDGECSFCEWFDAVHAIPRDVDLAWLHRFADATLSPNRLQGFNTAAAKARSTDG